MDKLEMKRLVPFLILAAFFLGISGGGVGRTHVTLQICACTQECPRFPVYLSDDELSSQWDAAEQPASLLGNFVFLLEPSLKSLLPWNWLSTTSQKHNCWLGLGCGGLPS
jgi:hypothetical protein